MTNEEAFKILNEHTQYFVPTQDLNALEMAMDALSEQKQGKWVFDGWGTSCSECGYRPKLSGDWNYCPNCEADMRDEKR